MEHAAPQFSIYTIGLVLLTASLVAIVSRQLRLPYSVGLVIAGRRQRTSRRGASLTLLPQATRAQGGLTLIGRF